MSNQGDFNSTTNPFTNAVKDNFAETSKFNYVITLNYGEALVVDSKTFLRNIGLTHDYKPQARLAIEAPQEISIMRLELFARDKQSYEKIIDTRYGEKIVIGENLMISMLPAGYGIVKVMLYSKVELDIKKSIFNLTPN